jgi:hypothetical protein
MSSQKQYHERPYSNTDASRTRLDWLSMSFTAKPQLDVDVFEQEFKKVLLESIGKEFDHVDKGRGHEYFYHHRKDYYYDSILCCQIYQYGYTEKQPDMLVVLTGGFFERYWKTFQYWYNQIFICSKRYINKHSNKISSLRITRADLTLDILEPNHKISDVADNYNKGYFTSRGQNPRAKIIGPIQNENRKSLEGSTIYVGSPKGDKRFRIYEKGKQLGLAREMPDWLRYEMTLKARRHVIPLSMIQEIDSYFLGMLPQKMKEFLEPEFKNVALKKVPLKDNDGKSKINALVGSAKRTYGPLIFYMLHEMKMTKEEIVNSLIVAKYPKSLKKEIA